MKAELQTSLSKLDVVYRVGFIVVLMFLGYRMALTCTRNEYLQDYMASLQPSSAAAAPSAKPTWPPLYPTFPNESLALLRQIRDNATLPCARRRTHTAHLFGLPPPQSNSPLRLPANTLHTLTLVSYEDNGARRCAGGDYFETDLSSQAWKARPPVVDNRDGSYSVELMVDARFAGRFVFRIVLLFANFHAFDTYNCTAWSRFESVVEVEIEFVDSDARRLPHALRLCREEDFMFKAWSGRWNRRTWNETCEIRDDGRFVCIDEGTDCEEPWCAGKVGALDSNGWVYSAHCKFKIFTRDAAWKCLNNRWLFFWGDSNHEDTVRNLLTFALGFPVHEVNHFRRWHNETIQRDNFSLTITKIFNGHHEEDGNLLGLASLRSASYRELLASFFEEERKPDTLVMNSGLHDAHFFKTAEEFASEGVDPAVAFWKARAPGRFVYRTTVAGAGFAKDGSHARDGVPNPHKMEVYNRIFVDRLREAVPWVRVVDGFDLTFPFHYDLNCTDGVHYGRAPSKSPWPWHPVHGFGRAVQVGHQYFVDVMLVHILLNAICPLEE